MLHPFRHRAPTLLAAAALACATVASARIDLSTLPERGDVELTIYNEADLTLVRETRPMSFREGENHLQFSWANTWIDPTSVHLRIVEGEDFLSIDDISYPTLNWNTLVWTIQANAAREGIVELTYFTARIRWTADYVVRANADETAMALDGFVRVTNESGEDYLNAKTRLIVGEVNLVETILQLARLGRLEDFTAYKRGEGPSIGNLPLVLISDIENSRGDVDRSLFKFDDGFAAADSLSQKEVAKEGVSSTSSSRSRDARTWRTNSPSGCRRSTPPTSPSPSPTSTTRSASAPASCGSTRR
jgi:hypothetical protein